MIKVDFVQGSDDWKRWRLEGLGASELAELLDESPYGGPKELLELKLSGIERPKNEWIMQKGHDIEPKIRGKLSMKYDIQFETACAEYEKNRFFRCSFDGYNPKMVIEAKYCGEKNLNLVPVHHWIQVQGQMAIANKKEMILARSSNGIDVAEIRIEFNSWFWNKAEKEIKRFQKNVSEAISAKSSGRNT